MGGGLETLPIDGEQFFPIGAESPEGVGVPIEPDRIGGDEGLEPFGNGEFTDLHFFDDAIVSDGDEEILVGDIDQLDRVAGGPDALFFESKGSEVDDGDIAGIASRDEGVANKRILCARATACEGASQASYQ